MGPPPLSNTPALDGECTFCGLPFDGRPNRCTRCGALLNDAVKDPKRIESEGRHEIRSRRLQANILFLVGLVGGGPILTLSGELRTGLVIVLAGGFASVLRRYSNLSTLSTVLMGSLVAAIVAAVVLDSVEELEATLADSDARGGFAEALSSPEDDIFVEARGPGLITIWFTVPADLAGECGDFPPAEVREHLSDLGFARVVVPQQTEGAELCSFVP